MTSVASASSIKVPPVVAVVSPKGGTGKTTIAVNLAATMLRRAPTVLVDLDTHFGDVEYALRLHPMYRLDEVAKRLRENPAIDIEILLEEDSRGLRVLCAPSDPVSADLLVPAESFAVVDKLIGEHDSVVMDTAGGISEFTIGALERANHAVLVVGTDVASVQAGKKLLNTMAELRLDPSVVHLVINRADLRTGLTVNDVEKVLGLEASLRIPDLPEIGAAMNEGRPYVMLNEESALSHSFLKFADQALGLASASQPRKRRHLFSYTWQRT
jgi:pilus assembly protein CpaE